ncbi:MAG TPA: zinc ribbon domain-containing protein [Paraburkholderia sp.]|uniref:FmdB family zinc ribbon protein n=1 Tax=Paraburkholderia sp. TaxID=1926495 RepID=UPI002ED3307B
MPAYDYECTECGSFETLRRIAERDEPAPCPQCGKTAQRVVVGAPALGGGSPDAREEAGSYGMRHRGGCSCC